MSKKIQLSIAEPCHENWENMSPDAKGKFCGSCQKQVVDFSNMSDRQVAEFFKKPVLSLSKGGSVCGRFMSDQLERPMEIPRKRIPWLKYFFQIAIPAFLVSIKVSGAGKTKIKPLTVTTDTTKRPEYKTMGMVARPQHEPVKVDTVVKPVKEPIYMLKGEVYIKPDTVKVPECTYPIMGGLKVEYPVAANNKEIEGMVVDQKGDPVPFASIVTPKFKLMADENGAFRFKNNWPGNGLELTVSSAGYDTKKMMISKNYPGKVVVQLNANVVLPEVVVTTLGQTRCTALMGSVTMVKGQTIVAMKDTIQAMQLVQAPVNENSLFVYPNPLSSGSSLNISLKKQEEGYYQLQIMTIAGQSVYQKEIWIDADAKIMNIDMPMVSAGTYLMVLTNKKTGKKYSEKIIIQ